VAYVPEAPFVAKTASFMLGFIAAEKEEDFVSVLLMLNQHLVFQAGSLAVHVEVIAIKPVVVLASCRWISSV
jgi:hypothetical protein